MASVKTFIFDLIITVLIYFALSFVFCFFTRDEAKANPPTGTAAGKVEPPVVDPIKTQLWALNDKELYVVTIDNCEYIFVKCFQSFSHKGNCTNCVHKTVAPVAPVKTAEALEKVEKN